MDNKVIFKTDYTLPYALEEAVNRLRINVSFLGKSTRKIMIISSEPNEGKSFVAFNLWKQVAQSGEKTVLLDLDMRKSTMVKSYGLAREDGEELKGMSHYLSDDTRIWDAIYETENPNADILPNVDNIVNPSMLLEGLKFEEMLDYVADNYRYAFLDAPPLGLVSDGELIANQCDGAILCVRSGITPRAIIRNSINQLERAGCPLIGIVLNRVDTTQGGYYHKYYGSHYYSSEYYAKG